MARNKPVKKSGPSTGGSVTSRVRDKDSGNKKVPVTSVTPKATTPKPSAGRVAGTRRAVAGAAMAATGVGGVARVAATKAASKALTPATKKVMGLQKEYNRSVNKANKAIKKIEKSGTPLSTSKKREIVQSYVDRGAAQRAKKGK